ncbi:MAG: MerR family transcriptional regulator [Xanthobacteraceae bacterium]
MEKAPDAFRTISEVAGDLDVPQHVLRFWETRFREIKPMKRGGGRRYYRPDDVSLLRGIRHLLYGEGYTIRGVQRLLREQGVRFVQNVWQAGAPQAAHIDDNDDLAEEPDTRSRDPADAERSRGLFGLLPSLLGDQEPQVDEPVAYDHSRSMVPPAPGHQNLTRDDLRRLQSALHELGECRRVLDAALREGG